MFSFFCILYFDLCRRLCVFFVFLCFGFYCFFGFLFCAFIVFLVFYSVFLYFFRCFFLFFACLLFCVFSIFLYKSTVNIRKKKSCFSIHLLLLEITDRLVFGVMIYILLR